MNEETMIIHTIFTNQTKVYREAYCLYNDGSIGISSQSRTSENKAWDDGIGVDIPSDILDELLLRRTIQNRS